MVTLNSLLSNVNKKKYVLDLKVGPIYIYSPNNNKILTACSIFGPSKKNKQKTRSIKFLHAIDIYIYIYFNNNNKPLNCNTEKRGSSLSSVTSALASLGPESPKSLVELL